MRGIFCGGKGADEAEVQGIFVAGETMRQKCRVFFSELSKSQVSIADVVLLTI